MSRFHEHDRIQLKVTWLLVDDFGVYNDTKLGDYYKMAGRLSNFLPSLPWIFVTPKRITINFSCPGFAMMKVISKLLSASLIEITTPQTVFGFKNPNPKYADTLNSFTTTRRIEPLEELFEKVVSPDTDFLLSIAPLIFQWIQNCRTTTLRSIYSQAHPKLIFYRNVYEEGERNNLEYHRLEELIKQIANGAFAFIPDTHLSDGDSPIGPHWLTQDLDTSELEYDRMLERILDYYQFLTEQVGITPIILHSGHNSFHSRILCGELTADQWGYILPRTESFEAFSRRRKDELKLTYLRDANGSLGVSV